MSPEDTLLNALEDAGLIHEDWMGIDHESLPKEMRDAVTRAIQTIRADAMCPVSKYADTYSAEEMDHIRLTGMEWRQL